MALNLDQLEVLHLPFSVHGQPMKLKVLGPEETTSNCWRRAAIPVSGYIVSPAPDILFHFGNRQGVYLDVGANFGVTAMQAAQLVRHVYACEPDPDNCALLAENLRLNNIHNVTIIPKALARQSGLAPLYRCPNNVGQHSLEPRAQATSSLMVETITPDALFGPEPPPFAFIKIDTEGTDLEVLLALEPMIARLPVKPSIKLEFTPSLWRQHRVDLSEFARLVLSHGYMIYLNANGTPNPLPWAAVRAIYDAWSPYTSEGHLDLYLIHEQVGAPYFQAPLRMLF